MNRVGASSQLRSRRSATRSRAVAICQCSELQSGAFSITYSGISCYTIRTRFLPGCGQLGIPGVSQVEKGQHRWCSYSCECMSLLIYVRFAAADVPLLYRCCINSWTVFFAGAFEVQRKRWVLRMAHKKKRTRLTHRQAPAVLVTKGRP